MKIKRAILAHGFNVSDGGAGSTDLLRAGLELQGIEVVEFDTKWKRGLIRDLLSVRFGNAKRARRLAKMIRPGDLLIGHSNGCALIDLATWQLADMVTPPKVAAIYLNPALDSDSDLAPQVKECLVFYTATDKTVGLARRLIASRWGAMGRDGYQAHELDDADERYINIKYENHGIMRAGHSGVFSDPKGLAVIHHCTRLLFNRLNEDAGS